MLGCSRLDKHACAVLYSPSDDDLLRYTPALLANLPDDGVLRMQTANCGTPVTLGVVLCQIVPDCAEMAMCVPEHQ